MQENFYVLEFISEITYARYVLDRLKQRSFVFFFHSYVRLYNVLCTIYLFDVCVHHSSAIYISRLNRILKVYFPKSRDR